MEYNGKCQNGTLGYGVRSGVCTGVPSESESMVGVPKYGGSTGVWATVQECHFEDWNIIENVEEDTTRHEDLTSFEREQPSDTWNRSTGNRYSRNPVLRSVLPAILDHTQVRSAAQTIGVQSLVQSGVCFGVPECRFLLGCSILWHEVDFCPEYVYPAVSVTGAFGYHSSIH